MCGIAGIIYNEPPLNGKNAIEAITDLIAHRGPDGFGYWNNNRVYFGHRRLSILDLSEAGAQPMEYNGYIITYNGEIYNYLEVRAVLQKAGYTFKSRCDTEVILVAYLHWGADCLRRFNGMWAFAIYDPHKEIVFCSRDRFGIKPFYYTSQHDKLIFGSEIKQMLAFIPNPKVRQGALVQYLAFTMTDGTEHTFFEGIKNLPGSHYLIYNLKTNDFEISRYYSISTHDEYKNIDYKEASQLFRNHFQRSIDWRLRSDVRVGTCLSGGLDSSFIALKASQSYQGTEPFCAFTAGSIDSTWSEVSYAKMVADKLNLEWHVTTPTTTDFLDDLWQVCATMEEPFVSPSVFMQHYVMRLAHNHGLKVLLDGQGGDETLFGYSRYIAVMGKQLRGLDKLNFLIQARKKYKLSHLTLLSNYFYFPNYRIRKMHAARKLKGLKPALFNKIDDAYFTDLAEAYNNPLDLQLKEITSSQIPALLRYEDRNSMHYSIETRLPYLDWELVEFNLSLQVENKIKDGWSKYLIRENMNTHLPDEITWRTNKFGYNAPDREWLKETIEFKKWIRESPILNHFFSDPISIAKRENGMLWKMINIACWEKIFNVTL